MLCQQFTELPEKYEEINDFDENHFAGFGLSESKKGGKRLAGRTVKLLRDKGKFDGRSDSWMTRYWLQSKKKGDKIKTSEKK